MFRKLIPLSNRGRDNNLQCSSHRFIIKLSRIIATDRSDVHAKGQGHRSRSNINVTKVKSNFVPIWAFPDCYSSLNSQMGTKWCIKLAVAQKRCLIVFRDHPPNFKVTRAEKPIILTQIESFWSSHWPKIDVFDPNWAFPDCNSSLYS